MYVFKYCPLLLLVLHISIAYSNVCSSKPTLRKYDGYSSYGTADKRDYVVELQGLLNEKGNYGLSEDGYFGSNTEEAVRQYQIANSLLVDGIVGPQTWGSLCVDNGDCNVDNPYDSTTSTSSWTPRTQFVVNNIIECFPGKFSCSGETRSDSSSDHSVGNAADCFPGTAGVKAEGDMKVAGDQLAEWLIENASSLKVHYIIWYKSIWNIERADEGWRECGTESTCKTGPSLTEAHYDHVHISVY